MRSLVVTNVGTIIGLATTVNTTSTFQALEVVGTSQGNTPPPPLINEQEDVHVREYTIDSNGEPSAASLMAQLK